MAQTIDKALCEGKWSDIPVLCTNLNSEDLYGQTVLREARVQQLLAGIRSTGFDPVVEESRVHALGEELRKSSEGVRAARTGGDTTENNAELEFIQAVTTCQLRFLIGQVEDARSQLTALTDEIPRPQWAYTNIVALKKRVLEARCAEILGENDAANAIYTRALSSQQVGSSEATAQLNGSWTTTLYYYSIKFFSRQQNAKDTAVEAALEQYYTLFKKTLDTSIGSRRALDIMKLYISYAAKTRNKTMQTQVDELTHHFETQIRTSPATVPKASDKNDIIENATELIMEGWLRYQPYTPTAKLLDIKDTLIHASYLTFHSCIVMRNLVIVYAALGNTQEALACFDTYVEYQDRIEVELKKGASTVGHVGDSLEGAVNVYSTILSIHAQSDGLKDIKSAKKIAESLYSKIQANINPSSMSNRVLSQGYLAIANAYARYYDATDLADKNSTTVATTTKTLYELSLKSDKKNIEAYFRYALFLAQLLDIEQALVTTKEALLIDETHLKSWHLLALLLSTSEQYDLAFQGLRGAKHVFHSRHVDLSILDFDVKAQLIQIEMTLVALLEAQHGTEWALEHVPEVFNFYSQLFPNQEKQEVSTCNGVVRTTTSSSIVRRVSLQSRDKTKSSEKSGKPTKSTKSVGPVKINMAQRRLLEDLWLWAAAIYRRANQIDQAEEAILEAEKAVGTSTKTRTALGLLMSHNRPIHAMEEFQGALEMDKNNLEATLGLAQLILLYSNIGKTNEGQNGATDGETTIDTDADDTDADTVTEKSTESETERATAKAESKSQIYALFISKKDELAAHAYVRGLLERHVCLSPGRDTSEAWWLLSEFYSKVHDIPHTKEALWRCIAIEEANPVRSFKHCSLVYS